MLDQLIPGQFDEWVAFMTLEPDRTERLVRAVVLGLVRLLRGWGDDIEPEDLDPGGDWEPPEVSPNQAVSTLRQAYGQRNR